MKFVSIFVLFSCTLNNLSSEKIAPTLTKRFSWPPINYAFEDAGYPENETSHILKSIAFSKARLWKDKLVIAQWLYAQSPSRYIPLVHVNFNSSEKSPKLYPFPNDLMKSTAQVNDLEIDICGRLWFYDIIKFKLSIFDLNQNKLIKAIQFDQLDYLLISSMTVDVHESDCDNTYAYMLGLSTNPGNQVHVYKFSDNKHWWIRWPTFVDQQKNEMFKQQFAYYQDSILLDLNGNRSLVLFVKSSGLDYLFTVPTSVLKNSENPTSVAEMKVFGEGKLHLSQVMYYNEKNSILFFGPGSMSTLICWNTKRFPNEFSDKTTETISMFGKVDGIVRDIRSDDKNNLLLLTMSLIEKDISSGLYTIDIKELVNGTVCDSV